MKFRDEDNLKPIILTDTDYNNLAIRLDDLSHQFDLIDLQFSSTQTGIGSDIEYSALALVRHKDSKEEDLKLADSFFDKLYEKLGITQYKYNWKEDLNEITTILYEKLGEKNDGR